MFRSIYQTGKSEFDFEMKMKIFWVFDNYNTESVNVKSANHMVSSDKILSEKLYGLVLQNILFFRRVNLSNSFNEKEMKKIMKMKK